MLLRVGCEPGDTAGGILQPHTSIEQVNRQRGRRSCVIIVAVAVPVIVMLW